MSKSPKKSRKAASSRFGLDSLLSAATKFSDSDSDGNRKEFQLLDKYQDEISSSHHGNKRDGDQQQSKESPVTKNRVKGDKVKKLVKVVEPLKQYPSDSSTSLRRRGQQQQQQQQSTTEQEAESQHSPPPHQDRHSNDDEDADAESQEIILSVNVNALRSGKTRIRLPLIPPSTLSKSQSSSLSKKSQSKSPSRLRSRVSRSRTRGVKNKSGVGSSSSSSSAPNSNSNSDLDPDPDPDPEPEVEVDSDDEETKERSLLLRKMKCTGNCDNNFFGKLKSSVSVRGSGSGVCQKGTNDENDSSPVCDKCFLVFGGESDGKGGGGGGKSGVGIGLDGCLKFLHSTHPSASASANNSNSCSTTMMENKEKTKNGKERVCSFEDAPTYLKFNPYITGGYRSDISPWECVKSLFWWTNETLNIWSHLLGWFFFLGLSIYDSLGLLTLATIDPWDRVIVALLLVSFQACMLLSALYHVFCCCSESLYRRWLSADLFGVSLSLLAIYISGIYYAFSCVSFWLHFYLITVALIFVSAMILQIIPIVKKPTTKEAFHGRLFVFGGWAAYGIVPTFHWAVLHGGMSSPVVALLLPRIFWMYGISVAAFFFYVLRVPEKLWPGLVNYIGSSHQLWHILIVAALYHWHNTGIAYLEFRANNSCQAEYAFLFPPSAADPLLTK